MDAAFAAHPLACPHCLRFLLSNPTVLMRVDQHAADADKLLQWQRLLAKYAYWYPVTPRPRNEFGDAAVGSIISASFVKPIGRTSNRLAFIGALQDVRRAPPVMPSMASRRKAIERPPHRRIDTAFDDEWQPPFADAAWPSFQTRTFIDLSRRYARFHHDHHRLDSVRTRRVTHWWRRSWDGAIARPITLGVCFDDPPFGVAEWVAFSLPIHPASSASMVSLVSRFDEDLQLTWDTWSCVLDQIDDALQAGLHPRLVPPRSCWLAEPPTHTDAPALGFF